MPRAAAKFCRFINAAGVRVEARVEQAIDPRKPDRRFPVYQSDDRSLGGWGEKAEPPATINDDEEEGSGEGRAENDPTAKAPPPVRNVLYVAAAKPLPPGTKWRLVFDAGLPAADAKTALPVKREVEVGTVQPFAATSVLGGKQPHRRPPHHPDVQQAARRGRDGGKRRQVDQARAGAAEPENDRRTHVDHVER